VDRKAIVFSSTPSLYNTLKRGVGLAFCPEIMVRRDIEEGRLVQLYWPPGPTETTVFMIRHADKWCSPVVSRFMEIAEERFASHYGESLGS